MLTDINPTGNGVIAQNSVAVVNGTAFFAANDGVHGLSLWKTDGTPGGTELVKVIDSNDPSSILENFYNVGGRLVFDAYDPVHGLNIWTSDGTAAGTVPLAAAAPATSTPDFFLNPRGTVVVGNTLYFSANGTQLWKSDGTEAGTLMVKDFAPAGFDSLLPSLKAFGSKVLFSAAGTTWISDGTDAGTLPLINGLDTGNGFDAESGAVLNGDLYFGAHNYLTNQDGLWKTDGTAAGTVQVSNIAANSIVVLNGKLIFNGHDPAQTLSGIYETDGTAAGTVALELVYNLGGISMTSPTVVGGYVLFSFGGSSGDELFRTDGTAAGTGVMVKDINPNWSQYGFYPAPLGSDPSNFAVLDGRLFFTADDGTHGREIWSSDGTDLGTFMAQDVNPGSGSSQPGFTSLVNPPATFLIPFGHSLLFAANDGVHGMQLWSSVGNQAPTASASPLTQTVAEGTPAQFDASASSDPDGDNLTYLWDFNGDGVFDASGAQVSHVFTADGVYPVTLKVIDGFGLSATTTVNVTVTEVQPTATISTTSPPPTDAGGNWTSPVGLGIPLNGSLTDPNPLDLQSGVNFTWTVTRDGAAYQSAMGQNFWFVPDERGTYVVTLTGTDLDGTRGTSQTIDVTSVPPTMPLRLPADLTALPAGEFDPSFGNGGEVDTLTPGYKIEYNVMAQQPDGKIVIAGSVNNGTDPSTGDSLYEFAVARYLANGTLDTTFGQNGAVISNLGLSDFVSNMTVRSDGKILVVGTTSTQPNGHDELALLQFNADGTPDTSFGAAHNGTVLFSGYNFSYTAAFEGDDVLATSSDDGAFTVFRFTAAGNLDPTFGPDGTGIVQLQPNIPNSYPNIFSGETTYFSGATALAVQGGDIYLTGELYHAPTDAPTDAAGDAGDFVAVVRLDANGNVDTTYGGAPPLDTFQLGFGGIPFAVPGWAFAEERYNVYLPPHEIAVLPSGQAVVFGQIDSFLFPANGSSGNDVGPTPQPLDSTDLVVQPDGKLLVAGRGFLTRLNPDLSPDTTFGPGGSSSVVIAPDPGNPDSSSNPISNAILLQSDGNVLVAVDNWADPYASDPTNSFLARYIVQPTHQVQPIVAGEEIPLTLEPTDPSSVVMASNFTYQINWGDGTPTQSVIGPAGSQVTHAYATAGTYTVTVTATDKDGGTSPSVSSGPIQIEAVTASNLQSALPSGGTVTIQVNTVADATSVVQAINSLSSQGITVNGTVSLDLAPITYGGLMVNVPNGMTLVIGTTSYTGGQQATIDPALPAFTVVSGNVVVSNVTFVTTGNAPTILVQGGKLTLRNDIIQESTANNAAISVTGGTVDLGTPTSPGNDTINVNGSGSFVSNATTNAVPVNHDTFEINGSPVVGPSLGFTALTSSQLAFTAAPTSTFAGFNLNIPGGVQVAVEDQLGDIVTGDTSTINVAISSGPTGGAFLNGSTTTAQAHNGVATFTTLAFNLSGTYALKATDGSLTVATVTVVILPNTGVLLLDPTGQSLTVAGNATLQLSNYGAIVLDSGNASAVSASGNASITATEIDVHGGLSTASLAAIHGVTNQGAAALADPLANLAAPPQPSAQFTAVNYSGTLQPGIYVGGITVSGNIAVTLQSGIYYLTGGGLNVSSSAAVTGTGVLLYFTGLTGTNPTSIKLAGNANVTLTPLTSGAYRGIVIFQDRTSNAAIQITGKAALNTTGTVYAPGATVTLSGTDSTDSPIHTSLGSEWIVADLVLGSNAHFTITANANNRNQDPNAFMVAGGPINPSSPVAALTMGEAQAAFDEALVLWAAAGVDAGTLQVLSHTTITISPLPTPYLGLAAPGAIYLDPTAEGYGWFTDVSPTATPPADRIDLLTVMTHELGHLFGLMDGNGTALMAPSLAAGVRILPDADDLQVPHTTLASFSSTAAATPSDAIGSVEPIPAALGPVLGGDLVPLPLAALLADENVNSLNTLPTTSLAPNGVYVLGNSNTSGSALAANNAIFSAPGQSLWIHDVPSDGTVSALTLGDAANLYVDVGGNLLGTVSECCRSADW
jgi:uncharacterized delta-60 repeat protein